MKQVFLKFPDEATANEFLSQYETGEGEDKTLKDPANYAVDVIGVIYELPVEPIDEENPAPPVALDGWHVNMLVPDDFESGYEVEPTVPRRVFAGWNK